MKPTYVLKFTHHEMVVLMQSLRYRFAYTESTRRSTTQRDLKAFDQVTGDELLERLSDRIYEIEDAIVAASEEVDQ